MQNQFSKTGCVIDPSKLLQPNKEIYAMKNGEPFLQDYVSVPLNDLGFSRGLTVFAVMEARGNVVFHLDDHIKRLRNSAISAFISPGNFDDETWIISFRNKITDLLKRNGFKESIVKIFMTGGFGDVGFLPQGKPNTYITVEDKKAYPIKESAKLGVMEFERPLPHIKKTDDYSSAIIEMMILKKQGIEVDDMLYVKKADPRYSMYIDGRLLECSRANIFLLTEQNVLLIPSADNVLSGVTRNIVLDLARKRTDLRSVEEDDISFNMLSLNIKEIFITSTTKGVAPVVLISDLEKNRKFEIGEFTLKIKEDFNNYREEYYKSRGV